MAISPSPAYDERQSALTIVGSRFGFCPLYYYADETGCWFASEVKALLSGLPHRTFDWKGVADFFYLGYMVGDRTLLEGVSALAAGEALTYDAGRLKRTKYYDFTKAPALDERDVSTADDRRVVRPGSSATARPTNPAPCC